MTRGPYTALDHLLEELREEVARQEAGREPIEQGLGELSVETCAKLRAMFIPFISKRLREIMALDRRREECEG